MYASWIINLLIEENTIAMIHHRATLQGLCKNEVDNHKHFEKRQFLQYHWYHPVCKCKTDNYQTIIKLPMYPRRSQAKSKQ